MANIESSAMNFVCKSAKMLGIKGSPEERKAMASRLNLKLYALVDDTFKKREAKGEEAYITKDELLNHFHKLCKNVSITLGTETNAGKLGDVRENAIFENYPKINGLNVALPFTKRNGQLVITKDSENIETVTHEFRHVFDKITKPKTMINSLIFALSKNLNETKGFYSQNLYSFEDKDISSQKFIQNLKKNITKHFSQIKISNEEKNVTLNYWLSSLKTEQNAFRDGKKYSLSDLFVPARKALSEHKDIDLTWGNTDLKFDSSQYKTTAKKQVALTKFKKEITKYLIKDDVDDSMRFDEKIKVVKENLKQTFNP